MDAKRWLIMYESDKHNEQNKNNDDGDDTVSIVPPYLLPMSKEFFMLEDCLSNSGSLEARDYIMTESKRLLDVLQQFDIDFVIPDKIANRIVSICGGDDYIGTNNVSPPDLHRHKLQELFNIDDQGSASNKTYLDCILLTLFGWRLENESETQADINNNHIGGKLERVTCHMCLNSQLCKNLSQVLVPTSKRQRVEGGSSLASENTFKFDMINSHRYFCPMMSGFSKKSTNGKDGGTSQPGWEVLLSSVYRRAKPANNKIIETEDLDENRPEFDAEKILLKIRKALRSPNASRQVDVK